MVGDDIRGTVVLGSIRKQAEQALESKPVSSTIHGLCLQVPALLEFLPSLLLMMNCDMEVQAKSFLPEVLLVMLFYHSSSNTN